MLGKKLGSFKKLAKHVKVRIIDQENKSCQLSSENQESLLSGIEDNNLTNTPKGYFAVYVGEERERFVVATAYLNHPLLKILLGKSFNEFVGFGQHCSRLVVPCTVSTFQQVITAVQCCNGRFDFGDFVQEFV